MLSDAASPAGGKMSELPLTEQMPRRPIYERYLQRKHHMPLDLPSEAEKRDAIAILRDEWLWADVLNGEALRVLDEAGR